MIMSKYRPAYYRQIRIRANKVMRKYIYKYQLIFKSTLFNFIGYADHLKIYNAHYNRDKESIEEILLFLNKMIGIILLVCLAG